MPGPYIHIAVSDRVRSRLGEIASWSSAPSTANVPTLPGPDRAELAELAAAHPSYYALGAIGPDLFFFLPDFRALCLFGHRVPIASPLIGVIEWIDGLYEKLDQWVLEDWERYFGPTSENIEEAISRFTGDLSTMVKDIAGQLSSIGTTALLDLVSQAHDWWGLFSLGLNKGYDNQDFFWSDMLHYRKTSQFALALWKQADLRQGDDRDKVRAYALGYMTHIAADVSGHAFVNEKSGGPYRLHWQRHHLVENHMDARTYDDDHGSAAIFNILTESALHYRIVFEDDGSDHTDPPPPYDPNDNSIRGLYVRRRQLDIDSTLPADLADAIRGAMQVAYNTSAAPTLAGAATSSPRIIPGPDGRPDDEAVETAYLWLFRYLKFSMLDGFHHEKPSPPDVFPNLDFPLLTDPHSPPPGSGSPGSLSGLEKCLAVIRFLLWIVAVAVWIVTVLPAALLDVATYLPRLAAYYAIELPLYYILKAERRVMVMTAFLHPMPDEIDPGLIQLCLGHDDAFLAALHAMDDVLGGLDDNLIGIILTEVSQLTSGSGNILDLIAVILGGASVTFSEPNPNSNYPHAQPVNANGDAIEYHAPWRYPDSPTELSPTFAGPYACGELPHVLLDGAIPGDQGLRTQFENSLTPAQTDQISFAAVTPENNLGDPVNFSEYVIWQLTRTDPPKFADWNLDADRGYAYKCWDWNRREGSDFILHDMEGHAYMEPCTPPPQQDVRKDNSIPCAPLAKDRPDPTKPLKLHWADQADPHCGEQPLLSIHFLSDARSFFLGKQVINVSTGVANTGNGTAINVKVTAINVIPHAAAVVVYDPQFFTIPFLVPAANALAPGGSAGFNLLFDTTSGDPQAPFDFDITAQADNFAPFTTTIHVP